jgi:ribosomal protein S30
VQPVQKKGRKKMSSQEGKCSKNSPAKSGKVRKTSPVITAKFRKKRPVRRENAASKVQLVASFQKEKSSQSEKSKKKKSEVKIIRDDFWSIGVTAELCFARG